MPGRRDSRPADPICPDYGTATDPGEIRFVGRSIERGGSRMAARSFKYDIDLADIRHVQDVKDVDRGAARRLNIVR